MKVLGYVLQNEYTGKIMTGTGRWVDAYPSEWWSRKEAVAMLKEYKTRHPKATVRVVKATAPYILYEGI